MPNYSPVYETVDSENFYDKTETKATPGSGHVFAASLATGEMHPLAVPFCLERFHNGALIDEHGAAAVAH